MLPLRLLQIGLRQHQSCLTLKVIGRLVKEGVRASIAVNFQYGPATAND